MNAISCEAEIRGNSYESRPGFESYARIGVPVQERHCPYCHSIIYSRRHKLCGVCAQELPDRIRFDSQQSENVKLLLREEQQRHRTWLHRFNSEN